MGSKMEGALAVFGGNLMTKAAGAVAQLGSEMVGLVQQGVELAKQGEGIRIAFERLGRGDLLDGLREATHGTVTDVELMKAAVKFDDFKLPLDELGTMLAFAQQKAKDTGQSVDYMVESLVTGLGRKSLMILDNLGLSATEVKDKMKETGDMTKAVGAIIREQMAKAGDYVETAADRAAQANVSLQNKMEELGRKFAPVEEASNQLWTSMKIAILDVVGGPLARLLNGLTEAGRLKNMLNDLNGKGSDGQTHTERVLGMLRHYSGGGRGIEGKRNLYNRQVASYNRQEEKAWREANRLREQLKGLRRQQKENGLAGNLQPLISDTSRRLEAAENRAKSFQIMRANYQAGAKTILNPQTSSPAGTIPVGGGKTGGSGGKTGGRTSSSTTVKDLTETQKNQQAISQLTTEYQALSDKVKQASDSEVASINKRMEAIRNEIKLLQDRNAEIQYQADVARGKYPATMTAPEPIVKPRTMNPADTVAGVIKRNLSANGDMSDVKALPELTAMEQALATLKEQQELYGASSSEVWQSYQQQIEDLGNRIEQFKGKSVSAAQATTKSWNTAASAISTVSSAIALIKDPAAKIMATIGQAIANVALAYSETLAKDPHSKSNVYAFIAAAASAMVSMVSTISTIKSSTKYAEGGIIQGNSYSGDNIQANNGAINLDAGELILNRAQQGVIAASLSDNKAVPVMQPYVDSELIFLGMNNTSKRHGRGEIVTTSTLRKYGLIP
jgi:hypothetical protein